MTRWEQVEKLCQAALELEENQRIAFLEQACDGDEELRREVESLLRFDKRGERFIEQPAAELAAKMMAHEKPQSLVGTQLGYYRIDSLLGAGGMGMVYKARDTRLNRTVAIKVLPSDRMGDPERKRRFIQEARSASALNHPNIITIHDIGSTDGTEFLVMEYVPGKTLDQRIPRKGMSLNEALKLAIQMADALAKAHSAGIIHRDLKPTNVMVTEEGSVKVLDFGLAKLTEVVSLEGEAPPLESLTEEGVIIGTVSYMSPEQAEGKKIDARSDIFSFGAVLYEMVTGQKAFEANSKMSTLAAIMKQEPPPICERVSGTPPDLEKLITRCLRKDPTRRFQDMADLKVALRELNEGCEATKFGETNHARSATRSLALRAMRLVRSWVWMAILFVAIGVTVWRFRGTAREPIEAPKVVPLTSYRGSELWPSFSPDGNQVAFCWNGERQDNLDIYVKLVGAANAVRLTTDPASDYNPAFSPDGRSIGFIRILKEHSAFIIIPAIGGPERIIADLPGIFGSFAWLPDGNNVVIDGPDGLRLLSTESGEPRSLTSSPTKTPADWGPAVSPDGRTIAFQRSTGLYASEIYLLSLTDDLKPKGKPKRLTSLNTSSSEPVWTQDGQEIVFTSYSNSSGNPGLWRVPASGAHKAEPIVFAQEKAISPAISRKGNRLAYVQVIGGRPDSDIWRLALSGHGIADGQPVRFIASTRWDLAAQYSPDGKRIAFESERSGVHCIWTCNADGSNVVELCSRVGANCGTPRWSPDGQRIAFDFNLDGNYDIYVIRSNGGKPNRLTTDIADDVSASWSRDGNWIYFASRRTGRWELWKVPAGGGRNIQITRNGGETAFESPDARFIYYTKGDPEPTGLWKMPVDGGEESQVLPSVIQRGFFPVSDGIYFISNLDNDGRKASLQFLSFVTNAVKTVAPISFATEGLSVSPDGRSVLFAQADADQKIDYDLMLVENFR